MQSCYLDFGGGRLLFGNTVIKKIDDHFDEDIGSGISE